jgi:alpha-tubulin suppressor-like RCC1 family protein
VLLIAVGLLAGDCYRPRGANCVVLCNQDSGCPRGMSCSAGLCTTGEACVVTVAAGETHSCAALAGQLKCWGHNAAGQLGQGDREDRGDNQGEMGQALPPVDLGSGRAILAAPFSDGVQGAIALGSLHTCALIDGGQVKCWGDNAAGQLGQGDRRPRAAREELGDQLGAIDLGTGRTAVALTAGLYHTCALLDTGAVKCWGDNRFGQLGIGAPDNRGGRPGEMGDDLPAVDLGSPAPARAIAAGAYHSCALLADGGQVKCWGWNDHGQLGTGDARGRGLAPADMGQALPRVSLGEGRQVVQIAAGAFHTCALLATGGGVKCWGSNSAGQLGLGDNLPHGTDEATLGDRLPVVELGAGRSARAITAGSSHTCALLDDFSVRCWGLNSDGQLGSSAIGNLGDQPEEMGVALPAVRLGPDSVGASSIAAGANHTCAVQAARVRCWGLNLYGRLGVGSADIRADGRRDGVNLVRTAD